MREVLEPYAKELEALGEPFEWVNTPDIRKKLGSEHFTAAVFTPGGALMNPAALTRGLAETLPENVTLFENSPVIDAALSSCLSRYTYKFEFLVVTPKIYMLTIGYTTTISVS